MMAAAEGIARVEDAAAPSGPRRDEYEIEVTVRDARGEKFGGKTSVPPRLLRRALGEMAESMIGIAIGDEGWERDAEAMGFERISQR